jgi:hypothetical protein
MTRVVVRIGRFVVHGVEAFAADTFSESLRQEIGRRIAQDSASHIAQRLQGNASVTHNRTRRPSAHHRASTSKGSAERSVAAVVAEEVFP